MGAPLFLPFCVSGGAQQFEEELAEQMGLYIHAGRGTGNNENILWLHKYFQKIF
jgi:hypothetical protein